MSARGERESLLLPILIPIGALVVIVIALFGLSRVLLSLKPNAATATALAAAVGIMAVAAFVAARKQVTGAALGAFVGAAAGIAMLAGGIAIAVIGPPEEEEEPFPVSLAAPEGAATDGFASTMLPVKSDKPIDLEFDNEDAGVGHNVQIFDGPDETAPVLFDGEVITGPGTTTYRVDPLPEGEYFFNCRVHPTTMTGTITSSPGAGGVNVVAENTAFDTDRIRLPADAPSTITLDNRDTAAHNLSIYEDESASGDPLFTFEAFVGPASRTFDVSPIPPGDYFFRCDLHPQMQGTVAVKPELEPPPPGEGGGGGEETPSPSPDGGG
jgi:plastocyanin